MAKKKQWYTHSGNRCTREYLEYCLNEIEDNQKAEVYFLEVFPHWNASQDAGISFIIIYKGNEAKLMSLSEHQASLVEKEE